MGFLDQLKRQADALQAQQQLDTAAFERNAVLVEGACKTAFHYWLDLARQLNVLAPVSRARYALDGRHVFEELRMTDFRVDARRKSLHGQPVHDHVQLITLLTSGQTVQTTKDMPHEIEKLESRLRVSGVEFHSERRIDPDTGRYLHTLFEFTADFLAGVKLWPLHETGQVQFQVFNLEGFESLLVEFPAYEISNVVLDELSKLVIGQPNRFVQMGQLRRRA